MTKTIPLSNRRINSSGHDPHGDQHQLGASHARHRARSLPAHHPRLRQRGQETVPSRAS